MRALPHRYEVTATARQQGDVTLNSAGLPVLVSAPPVEFGGPGDRWSPETLLVGAVVDCFVLTFRGVAKASALPWLSLACSSTGTLDRVDRVTRFTAFTLRASLSIPEGGDADQAERLLRRAEQACLIRNSLTAPFEFEPIVEVCHNGHLKAFA
jgi:organic hydroperoxide reductase OsmC/OhrA